MRIEDSSLLPPTIVFRTHRVYTNIGISPGKIGATAPAWPHPPPCLRGDANGGDGVYTDCNRTIQLQYYVVRY